MIHKSLLYFYVIVNCDNVVAINQELRSNYCISLRGTSFCTFALFNACDMEFNNIKEVYFVSVE